MKPFDLIEAVEGRQVKSSAEIMEIVRSVPLGGAGEDELIQPP